MTAVEALKALEEFIKEEVAANTLLQKESLTTEKPEYVHPLVALIALPHKNFTPTSFQVPHILIGFTNGKDDTEEHPLNIRIQFATFGGNMSPDMANIPDSSGYIDLLNLIELTKRKLIKAAIINGAGVVQKPISYGVYDEELTYPYWYGYLSFDLQTQITNPSLNDLTIDLSKIL